MFPFNWLVIIRRVGRGGGSFEKECPLSKCGRILDVVGQGWWGSWKLETFLGFHICIVPYKMFQFVFSLTFENMLNYNFFCVYKVLLYHFASYMLLYHNYKIKPRRTIFSKAILKKKTIHSIITGGWGYQKLC